ncbi:MAG TPA: slipin family protein [Actinomycetota bacterium]|jgi:regulator of protease activity HflC (stomatin/prohibitin superfamily)
MRFLLVLAVAVLVIIALSVRVAKEWERGVILRLGRVSSVKGPGLFFLIPIIDQMTKVSLQIVTLNVPPQDVITRDNVTVRVDAVVYFQIFDAIKATVEIQNYSLATTQIAQTTVRSILGQAELDQLLAERDRLNDEIQRIIDDLTEPWGVKVTNVEIRNVDLPQEMQRAMAKQAEAERERRSKVIAAEGEFQAAERLREAAAVLAREPIAYQLRFLQTIAEIATERNSTIVLPVPIELLAHFGGPGEAGPASPPKTS